MRIERVRTWNPEAKVPGALSSTASRLIVSDADLPDLKGTGQKRDTRQWSEPLDYGGSAEGIRPTKDSDNRKIAHARQRNHVRENLAKPRAVDGDRILAREESAVREGVPDLQRF